ncbi:MAG: MFS transporter [Candidatus Moraniibacteriota bacterium]
MTHINNFDRRKSNLIGVISFILGFFGALLLYILSAYFSEVSGSNNVSIFYLAMYAGTLLSLFFMRPIIRYVGKARLLFLSLGLTILCLALLTRLSLSWLAAIMLLLMLVFDNVTWVTLDIILEGFSSDGMSGRIRGMHLTITNMGVFFAPYFSTLMLDRFGYDGVFFVMLLGYILIFLIALIFLRNDNGSFREILKPEWAFRKMLREKDLLRIYGISLSLEFFYALMTIYTSLRLLEIGFSWSEIGLIFTMMLLPFVLLQYPLGALADRKMGEKELLIGNMVIIALATGALYFLDTRSIFTWGALLFLTRVGAAGIEVLRDSYFYKQVDGDDMYIIAFFRTARPAAGILGAVISAGILLLFPLKSVFLIVAVFFLPVIWSAFFLRDTRSERELAG